MKFLVGLWKLLSFPLLVLALVLGWYGVRNWSVATAWKRPVTLEQLLAKTEGTWLLRDSLDVDLAHPGMRQENFMGWKFPPTAVFPAHVADDSGASPLAVFSSDPRWLGPTVQGFLDADRKQQEIQIDASHGEGNTAEMRAMLQELSVQLRDQLALPKRDTAWFEGVATLQSGASLGELSGLAPQVWVIRTERLPRLERVTGALAASVGIFLLSFAMFFVVRRWDAQVRQREQEELEQERPLV